MSGTFSTSCSVNLEYSSAVLHMSDNFLGTEFLCHNLSHSKL